MSAARETIPTTGKKNPPFSPDDVAMRLAVLAADSMTDPSMIMLGTTGAVRPDMAASVGGTMRAGYEQIMRDHSFIDFIYTKRVKQEQLHS